jgi:hypothetical protein
VRIQVAWLTSSLVAHRVASVAIVAMLGGVPIGAHAQRVLTVIARDTSLEVSPTVPAGLTTVRLTITGPIRRELVVHRIPAGTMPADLARGAAGRPERWFDRWSFGGPAVPRDSAPDATATLDLRPGRYALVAYEVDAAGRARGDKYIWRDVTAVAASVLIPARFAVPDLTVKLKDSRVDVSGPVRTGQRILQVENAGGRPHEMVVGRLKPGKTIDDVRRWDRDRSDPLPFVYVGGLTPMSNGVTAQTKLVLQTGMHVVLCTMRHSGERERDYQRGVMASFKVN